MLPPAGIRASRAVVRLTDAGAPDGDPVVDLLRSGPLPLSTLARRFGRDRTARKRHRFFDNQRPAATGMLRI